MSFLTQKNRKIVLGGLFFIIVGIIAILYQINLSMQPVKAILVSDQPLFLTYGIPFDDTNSILSEKDQETYARALAKFPNIWSCIRDSSVNLIPIEQELKNIRSLEELNVCAFWAAHRLSDPEKLSQWLSRIGFDVYSNSEDDTLMRFHNTDGYGTYITASVPKKEIPFGLGSMLMFSAHSLTVSVMYDYRNSPTHAESGITYTGLRGF